MSTCDNATTSLLSCWCSHSGVTCSRAPVHVQLSASAAIRCTAMAAFYFEDDGGITEWYHIDPECLIGSTITNRVETSNVSDLAGRRICPNCDDPHIPSV